MNEIMNNICTRRSIRKFDSKAVEKVLVEQVVKAGIFAPTGNNIQTRKFTVITDTSLRTELSEAVRIALGRDAGYNFYAPPVFILVSDDKENENALANCSCALENMMLAAHSLGLGSVWINQLKHVCDNDGVRALLNRLNVPANHTVFGALSLGYALGEVPVVVKNENVTEWF